MTAVLTHHFSTSNNSQHYVTHPMKIIVDNKEYPSKKDALKEFFNAMLATDGSERDRMTYAYIIQAGYRKINTYKEIATK